MNTTKCVDYIVLILGLITLLAGLEAPAYAQKSLSQTKHVLLLNSYNQQMTWVIDIVQGVKDVLHPDKNNLTIHIENMDSKVFHSPEYFNIFREYLQVKYQNTHFSLILSSDNNAYDFLRNHRDKLFPDVPVVFCGVNNFNVKQLTDLKGFTGVAELFSARETVELALRLHPDTTELFVINDYLKTGRAWALDIDRDLQGLPDKVKIRHADDLPIEDLMSEISTLGPKTVVLLGVYFSDRDGKYFTYERVGAMLSEASNVPVYCLLEFNIGKGVIGGQVISGYSQGKAMARIGMDILNGTDPESIPVATRGNNRAVFDYNQLIKFNIKESLLPQERDIVNQPASFYQEYKVQIWTVIGFIVVLIVTILTLAVNIIRRMKAETALRASEERFRQLANASWEAIVIHEKGVFSRANTTFFDMFGFTDRELKGKQSIPLLFAPDSANEVMGKMEAGNLEPYEAIGRHKDGTLFPIEVRVKVMEYAEKDVRMAAIRDLSERKQMEEKLVQSQKLEAVGTLAGGIAHDFNNILSAIIGYSELTLMELPGNSRTSHNINEILRAGNRAKNLVQQILTFAHKGREEKSPERLDFIVEEALQLLRASLPTSIEIKKKLQSNAKIMCDTTQIHQIMMNLCANARKAMQNGGVLSVTLNEIDLDKEFVDLHPEIDIGTYLKLTISDNGTGIPAEIKSKIFDPFFTTQSKGEGTGLGLSVVHGIVQDCQGTINLTSQLGCGSTFDIYLPVIDTEAETSVTEEEILTGGSERILFVDDEKPLTDLAENMLSNLGYKVVCYNNGNDAINAFSEAPDEFDLIITDMTMPKMNGNRLATKILNICPDKPIILCTGYSDQITEEDAIKLGIKSFVKKPVVMSKLAKIIRKVLEDTV